MSAGPDQRAVRPSAIAEIADGLTLREVIELDRAAQLRLLELRNQDNVRKYMFTSHRISELEHFEWIARLKNTNTIRAYAAYMGDKIIGSASLAAISARDRRADWSFHISESLRGRHLGSALLFKFLDHVFFTTGLEKLNGAVLECNMLGAAMHKKFGFAEEGFRRRHILRENKECGVILFGLTKQDWLRHRTQFAASA
jgi:UDP-4-amino-4,6-dideoxy-N-acetyl-beta-L-altrosamine N-acetyltransferase